MTGMRLLHKSKFQTGHFPVSMKLLQSSMKMPSTSEFVGSSPGPMDVDSTDSGPLHQILHTSQSGTLALITPLSELSYRRLSGLATTLATTLDSACGLNPRAFRAVENELGGGGGTRGIVDGNLLMRWGELGEQKRRENLAKAGTEEWVFRAEREVLSGRGVFGGRV